MKGTSIILLVTATLPLRAGADPRRQGSVTLPLAQWISLADRAARSQRPPPPPVSVVFAERALEGAFHKGLLRGRLAARFQVLAESGHIRVPVLDATASVSRALLDGRPVPLVQQAGMYTVGVDRPGMYLLELSFVAGQEQERFARRLQLRLPPGGTSRLSLLVPEQEIEARLKGGALTSVTRERGGTRLGGHLDGSGLLELTWTRRLTHRSNLAMRMEASISEVITLHEALVRGLAVLDLGILQGETDRIDLRIPPFAEVMEVSGDAVLQWRTPEPGSGQLAVLLRHLVSGRVRIWVRFQHPSRVPGQVVLPLILPAQEVPLSGVVGVQAPAGLDVKVAGQRQATKLSPRDLPAELLGLTRSPLLCGFSFSLPPRITLSVIRHRQVELTSTLIDEVQASTVLTEGGEEITKLKLSLRNNTRQYLKVKLPEAAELTSTLLDGHPVRPALSEGALLFPLRQSERVDPHQGRVHRVKPGETLGDIAHLFYSDPDRWPLLLEGNRDRLSSEMDLKAGQLLRIPSAGPVNVEESCFVLEMAYRRPLPGPLGRLGRETVRLPELDVDALKVSWHLYLPRAVVPLRFDANLIQYTAIRHDPFRRLVTFLRAALGGRQAWAGSLGDSYKSILSRRKGIFRAEAEQERLGEEAPTSFYLVGQRYRFRRILAERSRPAISVVYVARPVAAAVRWAALLGALALTWLLLAGPRQWWRWLVAAAGGLVLLLAAHHVLGVHRRLVWGVDLALALSLLRLYGSGPLRRIAELARSPWTARRIVTPKNLLLVLGLYGATVCVQHFPMLLSLVGLALLLVWCHRARQLPRPQSEEGTDVEA